MNDSVEPVSGNPRGVRGEGDRVDGNLNAERERLSQAKLLAWLNREMQATDMVTVWWSEETDDHSHGIYCALIPSTRVDESLKSPCWDLSHGCGLPGATEYTGDIGEPCVEYLRFGDWNVEPLVIDREFHGIHPDYVELSEEFRLFHQLYHDRTCDQFLKVEDDGGETLVASIEPDRVQVRLKELRQFLAVKEMHLAIQFDCREHSTHALEELGLTESGEDRRDGLLCWGLNFGSFLGLAGKHRSFSRLLGKRMIPPLPKEKSGFWGFAAKEPKKYEDFIIGVDENGDEITHTSNPAALANNFGANPGAPHYLTPVHFRKTVLDKYYQQPTKYAVSGSGLQCGGLWSMYIDNYHDDRVVAWLGDLGRDLPHAEQVYWRSQNIPPGAVKVSETFYRCQILAECAESTRPEHVFDVRYGELVRACDEGLGWPLLQPLGAADRHHVQCIRIPSTDEQKAFDELVLGLAKILIDSLDEKALEALIPEQSRGSLKGSIAKLEASFAAREVTGYEGHVKFLRQLQSLRSTGSAHRKGRNYRKASEEFGIGRQSLRDVARRILEQANLVLEYLTGVVRSGKLGIEGSAKAE